MILRITIFLISFYFSEACVRTIPPEEVFITSTPDSIPGDNLCTECDISEISPTLAEPTATTFTPTELAATGECKMTKVECKRTDGKICESVDMKAINPTGQPLLMSSSNSDTVSATLSCGEDGKYSSGTVTEITKLTCDFKECVAPCYMCELSAVAPTLADPTNTEFVSTQSEDANQCPIETVSCKRKDGAVCASVKIQAITGATEVIGMGTNTDKADAMLKCAKDGTYTSGIVTGITKLQCDFTDCVKPCATCPEVDISKAELIPAGSMISKEEATTADGCKQTTIRCSYTPAPGTAALSSSLNGILADGMAPHIGEFPSPGIGKDYSILTCQNNGDYITSRGVTGIINFRCKVNWVSG